MCKIARLMTLEHILDDLAELPPDECVNFKERKLKYSVD